MAAFAKLKTLLRERAWQRDVKVRLASGLESNYYVDCKKVTLHGPSLEVVGACFWEALKAQTVTHVAGVSVGGDPLVAAVLMEAAREGQALEGLLVRKEKKSHGLSQGRAVDGQAPTAKDHVWLLEDVISTGGSSAKALGFLKDEGYAVQGLLCLVDREMGGVESLSQKFGIPVKALFKISEIVE